MRILTYIMLLFLTADSAARAAAPGDTDYLPQLAARLFPERISGSDFRLGKVIRFYDPDNLFEYIDGRASLYQSYGFVKLAHGEYAAGADRNRILLDIYDMGTLPSGFGIYAAERNPDLNFRPLGTQGYIDRTGCNFFRDRLYVMIEGEGEAEGEGLSQAVEKLAAAVAERLPGENAWPEALSLLPPIGKSANSEEYLPSALLGYSFLGDGYSARYAIGGSAEATRLFFTAEMPPEKAGGTFERLRDAWGGAAMTTVDYLPGADRALAGKAPYLGEAVIFLAGGRVGGLVGPGAADGGRAALQALLVRLTE